MQNPSPPATSSGPTEGLFDPELISLIQRLDSLLDGRAVPVELWACVRLADKDRLRHIIADWNGEGGAKFRSYMFPGFLKVELIKPWLSKDHRSSVPSTPQPSVPGTPQESSPVFPCSPGKRKVSGTIDESSPSKRTRTAPEQGIQQESTSPVQPSGAAPGGLSSLSSSPGHTTLAQRLRTPATSGQQDQSVSSRNLPSLDIPAPPAARGKPACEKTHRDQALPKLAHERDQYCVIQKWGRYNDGAHIFPIAMSKHLASRTIFWDVLDLFWSKERVAAWEAKLHTPVKTEFLGNMITMSKSVHAAWDFAEFALKPLPAVSCDPDTIKLEFHWLKFRASGFGVTTLLERPDLVDQCGRSNVKFWNAVTETKVCSGDCIELKTPSLREYPLPDEGLLNMQWILHRVVALAGGSEALDVIINNDSDGDSYGLPDDQDSGSVSGRSVSEITDDDYPMSGSNVKSSCSRTEHDMTPFDSINDEVS